MPLVTAAWCGFLRDGIEGRWEREAGVGRLLAWKDVFGETQETGAAGCSIPLPVEPPPPRGRFPIDTVPCRRQALIGLTESSMKSRFCSPCTVSGLSPCTARPLEGGGRRPRERPGGGGDRLTAPIPFPVTRGDKGKGRPVPSPLGGGWSATKDASPPWLWRASHHEQTGFIVPVA